MSSLSSTPRPSTHRNLSCLDRVDSSGHVIQRTHTGTMWAVYGREEAAAQDPMRRHWEGATRLLGLFATRRLASRFASHEAPLLLDYDIPNDPDPPVWVQAVEVEVTKNAW